MKGNFGFIHGELEIKILLLFIMRRIPEPVGFDVLAELAMCDDAISYFDFTDCVNKLVGTGHLLMEGGKYSLTQKGIRNGEITENNIPYSVRAKAEGRASVMRAAHNRNAMIRASRAANPEGGFTVSLSLSDGVGDIASMELYAGSDKHAQALEEGFRKNAESIYNKLIEMLLG